MNRTYIRITAIFAVIIVTILCLPSSWAKYLTNDAYKMDVQVLANPSPIFKTNNSSTDYSNTPVVIPIEKTGYYSVITKGGNGGAGICVYGSEELSTIAGGTGGLVSIKVWLVEGSNLVVYIGHNGGKATIGNGGTGGSVKTIGSGGTGNDGGSSFSGIAKLLSHTAASGGGGAATTVFVEGSSVNANSYSPNYSNLLSIAAGGGGGGAWSQYYCYPDTLRNLGTLNTVPAGFGGPGGSNVIGYTSSSNDANIFYGDNGKLGSFLPSDGNGVGKDAGTYVARINSSNTEYGGGGNTSGGSAAASSRTWGITCSGNTGGGFSGSNSAGAGANSTSYGGAGGGGYCGGGSGSGTSISYSAGGGGGGSSFFTSNNVNGKAVTTYSGYSTILSSNGFSVSASSYNPQIVKKLDSSSLQDGDSSSPKYPDFKIDRIYNNGSEYAEGFVMVNWLSAS